MPCVFCGSQVALTDEHVYARWMRETMRATGRTTVSRGAAQVPVRTDTGLTVLFRKGVCRACNTGWLSGMERTVSSHIRPALLGQKIVLTPEAQQIVAAWAVKQALLLELAMRLMRKKTYAPESNLRWLYDNRHDPVAPPGSQVWLAAVDAQLGTEDSLTAWNKAGCAGAAPADPDQFFVAFSAGYLLFQVAGQDFQGSDHLARFGEPLMTFIRPQELLSIVVSIWPRRDELVVWPPPFAVRRADLPRLADWAHTTAVRHVEFRIPQLK